MSKKSSSILYSLGTLQEVKLGAHYWKAVEPHDLKRAVKLVFLLSVGGGKAKVGAKDHCWAVADPETRL